jgi:hypothetical protein
MGRRRVQIELYQNSGVGRDCLKIGEQHRKITFEEVIYFCCQSSLLTIHQRSVTCQFARLVIQKQRLTALFFSSYLDVSPIAPFLTF